MRYYHVADPSYQVGEDLLCRDALERDGIAPAWKWEDSEEGYDGDVICLFEQLPDALEFRRAWLADGLILVIDLPDELVQERAIRLTRVSEGYPAVYGRIDAEYITTWEPDQ